jgi:hypothetical protein
MYAYVGRHRLGVFAQAGRVQHLGHLGGSPDVVGALLGVVGAVVTVGVNVTSCTGLDLEIVKSTTGYWYFRQCILSQLSFPMSREKMFSYDRILSELE